MKKMMILGAGILQVPAIRKAKELGYQIIAVDYDENALGFSMADVKLVVSTLDQEEVYRQALIYQPDVVITSTSDGPVRTAAYVNEKLGKRPDLSYEDSLCATIKSHMRDRLKEEGVPIPAYFVIHDQTEFMKAVRLNGHRSGESPALIIKPADNAGSRGVVLLEGKKSEQELVQVYEYSKSNSRNGIVMVEEFMEGPEVSVEAMTVDGETTVIAITDKLITPPPYFVELGHSEPSCLKEEVLCEIKKIALQAVKAIRLQNGPSHTEVKVTKDGPKIVELAARLGGDFITSKLVPLSTGVDLVRNSVLLAAGEKTDLKTKWQKGSAIRFLGGLSEIAKTPQIIKLPQVSDSPQISDSLQLNSTFQIISQMTVDEKIYELEGIEEVVLYKAEGDMIHDIRSSNDRIGHVITSGETAAEAIERAEEALKYIQVIIEWKDQKVSGIRK